MKVFRDTFFEVGTFMFVCYKNKPDADPQSEAYHLARRKTLLNSAFGIR